MMAWTNTPHVTDERAVVNAEYDMESDTFSLNALDGDISLVRIHGIPRRALERLYHNIYAALMEQDIAAGTVDEVELPMPDGVKIVG